MGLALKSSIVKGDSLAVLRTLESNAFDDLICDPPYASGGANRSQKALPTSKKYQQSGTKMKYPGGDFPNDALDQRSWIRWCIEWLSECRRVVKPNGYALVFIDWRQLPALTDAFQISGWTWRGIISWDKTESSRAPHKGYFRHQTEFIVWGTNGSCLPAEHAGPFPGVYRYRVDHREKRHVTGKPLALMRDLVQCTKPSSHILDPFAGSGMTIRAAVETGRSGLGIELSDECYEVAVKNLAESNAV